MSIHINYTPEVHYWMNEWMNSCGSNRQSAQQQLVAISCLEVKNDEEGFRQYRKKSLFRLYKASANSSA